MQTKFEIYKDGEFWCARGIEASIFTQGETLDRLVENMVEAVELYFEDAIEGGEEVRIVVAADFEIGTVVIGSDY